MAKTGAANLSFIVGPDGLRRVCPLAHTHTHTRSPDANVDMLDCCRPLEWVKRYGITLAEFAWVMCIIALEGKKLIWAAYLAV